MATKSLGKTLKPGELVSLLGGANVTWKLLRMPTPSVALVKYPRVPKKFAFLILRQCPPRSAIRGSRHGQSGGSVGKMGVVTLSKPSGIVTGGVPVGVAVGNPVGEPVGKLVGHVQLICGM